MELRFALSEGAELAGKTKGAALFADVSGFTPLMATLAAELGATRGAEEVTRLLDELFTTMTDEVHRRRGSVVDFAGDSMLCWFDDTNGKPAIPAVERARATAIAMRDAMTRRRSLSASDGARLGLDVKIAVASGAAHRLIVGDPRIRRMLVLTGGPVDRAATGERLARPGEIVCSEESANGGSVPLREQRESSSGHRYFVVGDATHVPADDPWPPCPALPIERVRQWLLPSVAERLERGAGAFLGGFKPAVAIFVRFTGIDYDDAANAGARIDSLVTLVQRTLDEYGGDLLSVTVGDKGSYLYGTFGALRAHENDARRAVASALALQERSRFLGFDPALQIGVAEGASYTGAYGGAPQRTFGVLGKDVNLAARLMSEAGPGRVLVSPSVAEAVVAWFELREQPPMVLKGLERDIAPHLVVREHEAVRGTSGATRALAATVGRATEIATLEGGLDRLARGEGTCFLIEGEAGIGKSHVIEHLVTAARSRGAEVLLGSGDPLRSAMPYAAWRAVFEALLGVAAPSGEPLPAAETRMHRAGAALVTIDAASMPMLPLLGPVLGIDIPDTAETARLAARARADNTNDLLLRVLQRAATTGRLLLVLEDAHWFDSASASLLARVVRDVAPALVLVTTRPHVDGRDDAVARLLTAPRVDHIVLGRLDPRETDELVCRHLGVTSIPPSVSQLIAERAEGSPFFSQQLADALVQSGHITVTGGVCAEAPAGIDPGRMSFPATVQGLITSRIDSLPSRQQLAVKVASVIGRYFSYRTLRDVHPVSTDKPTLLDDLAALAAAGVTVLQGQEPELAYSFGHALTHEVAYGSLLYRQRCDLHRALGRWYEEEHATDLGAQAAVLAHHWSHAARGGSADALSTRKAIDYLELAGTQALRSYSNREAARFLGDAVALDAERPLPTAADDVVGFAVTKEQLRRARWHSGLGHAHLALSDFARCRDDLYAALELLGHAVPRTRIRLGVGILAQIAKQAGAHVARPASAGTPLSTEEKTILSERTDALRILAKAFFHESNPAPLLYTNLCNLNYSEHLGPSSALALIHSHMLLTLGVFQMHRWARSYGRRSLEIARRCDDPGTLVTVLVNHGVYHTGNGEWSSAREVLEEGISLAEQLGDHTQWGECVAILADAAQLEGDLARSGALYAELATSAERRGNTVQAGWSMRPRVLEALQGGDPEAAIGILTNGLPAMNAGPDALIKIDAHGLLALAQARAGDWSAALESIARANALIEPANPPVTYPRHLGLGAVAEACLLLLERSVADGAPRTEQRQLHGLATLACRNLHRYRRVFAIGAPAAWRYQGWLHAVLKRPRRARTAFDKSIAAAVRLKMSEAESLARTMAARRR